MFLETTQYCSNYNFIEFAEAFYSNTFKKNHIALSRYMYTCTFQKTNNKQNYSQEAAKMDTYNKNIVMARSTKGTILC